METQNSAFSNSRRKYALSTLSLSLPRRPSLSPGSSQRRHPSLPDPAVAGKEEPGSGCAGEQELESGGRAPLPASPRRPRPAPRGPASPSSRPATVPPRSTDRGPASLRRGPASSLLSALENCVVVIRLDAPSRGAALAVLAGCSGRPRASSPASPLPAAADPPSADGSPPWPHSSRYSASRSSSSISSSPSSMTCPSGRSCARPPSPPQPSRRAHHVEGAGIGSR